MAIKEYDSLCVSVTEANLGKWAKFEHMGKVENMYADDVNFTELNLAIAGFNRLVQSSGFTFKNDGPPLDVLQWLSKRRLSESTP